MQLPFDIAPATAVFLMVLFGLYRALQQRDRDKNQEDPKPKVKWRGPDMTFSAGRDAAHQNARFLQVFIPMEPQEEPALRHFYLDVLGLTEMRAPNYPKDMDGFWAVSGSRQIYLGTLPSFPFDTTSIPAFPISNLDMVAERLTTAGYRVNWNHDIAYVKRLVVTDPADNQIGLIAG